MAIVLLPTASAMGPLATPEAMAVPSTVTVALPAATVAVAVVVVVGYATLTA